VHLEDGTNKDEVLCSSSSSSSSKTIHDSFTASNALRPYGRQHCCQPVTLSCQLVHSMTPCNKTYTTQLTHLKQRKTQHVWPMLLMCCVAQPRLRVTQYMQAAPPTITLSMSSWKPQKVLVPLGSSPSQQPSAHDASRSAPARMRYASLSLPAGAQPTESNLLLWWLEGE
jgi:hypothetical protein